MENIYRLFIEKKEGFDTGASTLYNELTRLLKITELKNLRMLYRYYVQGVTENEYFEARDTVFSDPPQDIVYEEIFPSENNDVIFGVEYLPGQYDQRSDSAAQCIQILTLSHLPF